jgi:hypothetical protein
MSEHDVSAPSWRDRLRLVDVELQVDAGGSARVSVELALPGSPPGSPDGVGNGWGLGHREGRMRAAADATIEALSAISGGRLSFELRGMRAFRAFDTHLVAVSIHARAPGEEYRLIGSVAAPGGDLVRGTAMAVLDAVNRVLDRHVIRPESGS